MFEGQRDPLINAIQNGIKADIEFTQTQGRHRATVILIYSAMDAMAFLGMPSGQKDVKPVDFIGWAERYIRFPCKEQITGKDFYGARCAMLHTYTIESKISRNGDCRQIGYMDDAVPEVRFAPHVATDLVLVSIRGLKDALFGGIDQFLVEAFSDAAKAATVEERLKKLIHTFPANAA